LVEAYLTDCQARGLARGTIENSYGYPLRKVFLAWCARRGIDAIAQLDREAVNDFAIELQRGGGERGKLSKHSVHAYVRSVRGFLAWCGREGEGQAAQPPLPRLPRILVDVLDREEVDRLETATPTERNKLMIRLLGDCGLRADELCRLRTGDILQRDRRAEVHVTGKGSEERLVPLVPGLHRRLDRYLRGGRPDAAGDHIFVSLRRGKSGEFEPLTPSGVLQVVKDAADRAGIRKRVYTHLLRHTFITNALRAGMNPLLVAKIVGHSSLKMITEVYEHLNRDDAYDAMVEYLRAK